MPDIEILQMALIGYQAERRKINEKIAALEARLKGSPATPESAAPKGGKRKMSRAAKARIAEAQRKRWAEFRKDHPAKPAPAKAAKKKVTKAAAKAAPKAARKPVSPEVRQKRLEALTKARAARAAKRNAAA